MESWYDGTGWSQLLLACALCADAASVAFAAGVANARRKEAVWFAGWTGMLHAWFPFISARAGGMGAVLVGWYAPLVSGILFGLIGLQMMWISLCEKNEAGRPLIGSDWRLAFMAIMVSVDAMTAGFSVGLLRPLTLAEAAVLGGMVFFGCMAGWYAGKRLPGGDWRWSGAASGFILVIFGLKMLMDWI